MIAVIIFPNSSSQKNLTERAIEIVSHLVRQVKLIIFRIFLLILSRPPVFIKAGNLLFTINLALQSETH